LIIDAVPVSETAAANGLNALMRAIGTSTSSAVVSAVLATMAAPVAVDGAPAADVPTAGGFTAAAAVCLGAALVSTALAACVPRTRARRRARGPAAGIP